MAALTDKEREAEQVRDMAFEAMNLHDDPDRLPRTSLTSKNAGAAAATARPHDQHEWSTR